MLAEDVVLSSRCQSEANENGTGKCRPIDDVWLSRLAKKMLGQSASLYGVSALADVSDAVGPTAQS
jgi:hypothetical protein